MRRNLVIVRAGDQSLHPAWLKEERSWDLIVNYFGDDPALYRADGVRRIDSKGPKWPALHELMGRMLPELNAYDYVWFPDDDLACDPDVIERFFALCHEHKLELAQPALTHDSHIGVAITVGNRSFVMRYTNFIEIMAPCFSRAFLNRCWESFNVSLSGWGLDFVWPKWADDPLKVAILDATPIKHTRPHGGPNYRVLKERGVDPDKELHDLLAKEKIEFVHIVKGGLTPEGKRIAIWNGEQSELIRRLMAGYLPEFKNYPDVLYAIIEPILKSVGNLKG